MGSTMLEIIRPYRGSTTPQHLVMPPMRHLVAPDWAAVPGGEVF